MASNDCLPYEKKTYLPVVVAAPSVEVIVVVEEVTSVVAEGVVDDEVSVVAEEDVESASLLPLQAAAKAAIANTKKSFFMFSVFLILFKQINLGFIPHLLKGNPAKTDFFNFLWVTISK